MLSRDLGIPVAVQDTTKAITLAETIAGAAREARSAVVIDHGGRLGVGLIIDGRPYAGSTGVAGAIGHVPCMAARRRAAAGGPAAWKPTCRCMPCRRPPPQTIGKTYDEVDIDALRRENAGNEQSQNIIRDVIDRVAHTATMIEALLDPELVIVGGG